MGGFVNDYSQTFNITSRTSGYVPGATNLRHCSYGTYAGYVQDNWRVLPRLTLNLGLRYDYYARVTERDSLTLLPQLMNNNFISTLLSNSSLNFAGNSVGRPYYNRDLKNFAPNLGLAWDIFGTGKTVIRGGYSISYVNDDLITSARQNVVVAAGVSSAATNSSVAGTLSSPPTVPTPVFQVPRTAADNYHLSTIASIALPDPNLRTPYVQQWLVGVEHQVLGAVASVRYVGNHGVKLLRQIDYNQINVPSAFLADFVRARSNLLTNGSVTVGQPPTYLPTLPSGGSLTNSTVINNIRTGAVAELASYYSIRPQYGVNFYPNPLVQNAYSFSNQSNSTYNALAFDIRKNTRSGIYLQFSYVYSKAMGDGTGDSQTRLDPLLDNNNLKIEHSREPWDVTHVFRANYAIDLPFGEGKRFQAGRLLNHVIGGWNLSGIWNYESGTVFSILSGRGTFNRGGRSAINTVNTTLTKDELDQVTGFFMTGDGPYFISPSVIGPDGRGVAADGAAPFTAQQALMPGITQVGGQVFFNRDPGALGSLQRRWFSGPWNFSWDMAASKTSKSRSGRRYNSGRRHSTSSITRVFMWAVKVQAQRDLR
jgi:TonB dependent receptor